MIQVIFVDFSTTQYCAASNSERTKYNKEVERVYEILFLECKSQVLVLL
jgi:hypothetical protein